MATVTNPTDFSLFCEELKRDLAGGESVEVTDDQAARISATIFVVDVPEPVVAKKAPAKRAAAAKKVDAEVESESPEVPSDDEA